MHRQRHASAHRSKLSSSSSSILPSAASIHAQKVAARSAKKLQRCSKRLFFLCVLLICTIGLLLFGKTPPDYIESNSKFVPGDPSTVKYYTERPSIAIQTARPRLLSYKTQIFTLDGVPIRLVSGSVHYFRMPPSRWRPILQYARGMGLNAIETYIPWNLHEPVKGMFRFSGMLDLRGFLEIAHEVGLLVLLRPGPYICSEWDLGGLPAYLLAKDDMRLRSTHIEFLKAAMQYMDIVAKQIAPYIGKPIVGIQIENEYGAYGHERAYLKAILEAWEGHGFTRSRVLLFTSDNGGTKTIMNGSPFDSSKVLKTINLEVNVREKIEMLRKLQPDAPAMIAEFWTGWFDHWGENHHVRSGLDVVNTVRSVLLDLDASINLYMFFGGTNFAFMSGANLENDMYLADVTSYDYDAFITEYGEIRKEKYVPMQTMLRRFWKSIGNEEMHQATLAQLPKPPRMSAYGGPIPLGESIPLFDVLPAVSDQVVLAEQLLSMEKAGGDHGFVLYRHNITQSAPANGEDRILQLSGVRDFAYVLADGLVVKTIDRNREVERETGDLKKIRISRLAKRLDIIVENRGRVNYGAHIHDRKGILEKVLLDSQPVSNFEIRTMSFAEDHVLLPDPLGRKVITAVSTLMNGKNKHPPMHTASSPPTFFRGEMTINPGALEAFGGELPGTHCRVFGRGVLWVNGFNVGRFHTGVSGPQRSLFVPGALLREGKNEFVVLHMNMYLVRPPAVAQLFEQADLGVPNK